MEQKAAYSFEVQEIEGGKRFTYVKGRHGFATGCSFFIVVGIVVIILINLLMSEGTNAGETEVYLGVIVSIISAVLLVRWTNKKRVDGVFEITDTTVTVEGKSYSREDIHNLFIEDPKGKAGQRASGGSTMVVGGRGMAGAVAVGAESAARGLTEVIQMLIDAIGKIKFKIKFRFGEKDIVLAKGLTEKSSKALFDKLKEELNFV